jgi:hypothetical protein
MLHRLPAPLAVLILTSGAAFLTGCRPLGGRIREEQLGCFGLLWIALAVYALINIVGSNAPTLNKVLWGLLVWLMPVLGFIIWFIAGPRRHRRA